MREYEATQASNDSFWGVSQSHLSLLPGREIRRHLLNNFREDSQWKGKRRTNRQLLLNAIAQSLRSLTWRNKEDVAQCVSRNPRSKSVQKCFSTSTGARRDLHLGCSRLTTLSYR